MSIERFAPNRHPLSIQPQFVHLARSTATGTGLHVCPVRWHSEAQTPPAYVTSFHVCSETGRVCSARSYHGSIDERLTARGQSRRPISPRRSKTNEGARSAAAK